MYHAQGSAQPPPPPPPPPPPGAELPPGWTQFFDGNGRAYYHHHASGQTSWHPPGQPSPPPPAIQAVQNQTSQPYNAQPSSYAAQPQYAQPEAQPQQQYAQPGAPSQQYAHSGASPQQYAQPGAPPQQYAQSGAPPQQYAQPGAPTQYYAQPGAPPQQYAQPGPPQQQYAQPGPPQQQYAQPGAPRQQYEQYAATPQQYAYPPLAHSETQIEPSAPNIYSYNPQVVPPPLEPPGLVASIHPVASESTILAPALSVASSSGWFSADAPAPQLSNMSLNTALYQGVQLGPGTPIKLEVSAVGLKNHRPLGWSDAICWVELRGYGHWVPIGTTEVIKNARDPHWTKRFDISHHFEAYQEVRFVIRDSASRNSAVIAQVAVPLGELVGAEVSNLKLRRRLSDNPQTTSGSHVAGGEELGVLVVRIHSASLNSESLRVRLCLAGRKLDNKDGVFGKSDPYFQVEQLVGSSVRASSVLARSEVVMNNLSPSWLPVLFKVSCNNGDRGMPIKLKISVYDKDDLNSNDLIGSCYFELGALQSATSFDLINEEKRERAPRKYTNSGQLIVNSVVVTPIPSFISYLQGGCRMRFMCAVDFTKSNGDPRSPGSLHYSDGRRPSPYAQALEAVGHTIAPYLAGNNLEAFGYGGIPPGSNATSFDFPLHPGRGDNGAVEGVGGLMDAYNQARGIVRLGEPTNFTPILSRAMSSATSPQVPTQMDQHYTVLLILTDGQITDLETCVDKIIEASRLHPLSIVIVGIGSGDFSSMKRLDGDDRRLRSRDGVRKAERDIVQFVHWQSNMSLHTLTAQVLSELPTAVVDYFVDKKISPNTPCVAR